ncbi:acyl carrier protein [Bailinhaonella thermotolerans]|uniref:Acyl carrier protein n=1 Tax=Bailinhaonella thermotolerans TaxID=1070861 RepID=A0A3A4AY09_9ACTN|nr:acyl carrier protein [Bailinhaonella thermotolerans]RJL35552.1 acyl carrier protein [Bailinhaonella thermotolerans]
MDPAWVAVIAAAVGALGAAGAAAIAGRAARRQITMQSAGQRDQWRRQTRRDAYSAFLDAGVQARDELTSVWRLFKTRDPDLAGIDEKITNTEPFVSAVKRASATVFVEGPTGILEPTLRAEESITLFRALLRQTLADLRAGRDATEYLALCARQEHLVRDLLDRFAAFARGALDEAEPERMPLNPPQAPAAEEEVRRLRKEISEHLETDESRIDVKSRLVDQGLDSLHVMVILNRVARDWGVRPDGAWPISSFFDKSIEEIAAHMAAQRDHPTPGRAP